MQSAEKAVNRVSAPSAAVGGVFLLALAAALLIPMADRLLNPESAQPGVITYLGVGLSTLAVTAVMLFAGLRHLLPRTAIFVVSFLGYNALLITVKFVISPIALYTTAGARGLSVLGTGSGGFGYIGFPMLTLMTAALYGTAFFLLGVYFRSRLRRRLGIPVRFETRFVSLYLTMFCLGAVATISIGWLAGLDYFFSLLYVTALAALLALALLGALGLCTLAFAEAADQAAALRNATTLTGFAWVGLAFIAAYHVLWIVFVLVIITLWPLKSISYK